METFHFSPRPGMGVSTKPNVTTVNVGDGYEQRRAAGDQCASGKLHADLSYCPREIALH